MLGAIRHRNLHATATEMETRFLRIAERPFAHSLCHCEQGGCLHRLLFYWRWAARKPKAVRFADDRVPRNVLPEDFSDFAGGLSFGPKLFERVHHCLGPNHRRTLSLDIGRNRRQGQPCFRLAPMHRAVASGYRSNAPITPAGSGCQGIDSDDAALPAA